MVALTFDDGPYVYTPALLDILAANNAKATFFVVGDNGGKGQIQDPSTGYPAIIRRMIAEGHQVGCQFISSLMVNSNNIAADV